MKCFNHDVEAIGLCKHCQRALCKDCCVDLGHGLACKGAHEEDVEIIESLIQNNKKAYESHPKATLFGPIFNLFMGAAFLFFGYQNGFDNFLTILGAGFVIYGVAIILYNKRFFASVKTDYKA